MYEIKKFVDNLEISYNVSYLTKNHLEYICMILKGNDMCVLSTVVAVLLGTLTSYSCELKVNIQSVIKN
jgi:hypothetical protein